MSDDERIEQRHRMIEEWYREWIERNPAVTRDDIESVFDQLDEIKPTAD